ncbi:SWPV1-191 [Shearwaterpox virus]|uniref:SWPV1-191 n=1 Tax=Shearwaterpox virus TaxID=1974596 RepID=A0A1V0S814_CNPV|nr:SWPV1-191 [Shearwaterpox virus]
MNTQLSNVKERIIMTIEGITSSAKEKLVNMLSYNCNINLTIIPNDNLFKANSSNGYKDIINMFCENPYKYAYPFKTYQLLSKLDAYIKANNYQCDKKTILLDGSIDSEKYIFAPMFVEFKFFTKEEAAMYCSMCDWYINNLKVKYDGAIYVKTSYKELSKDKTGINRRQYAELVKNYEIWIVESSFPILVIEGDDIINGDYLYIMDKVKQFVNYLY